VTLPPSRSLPTLVCAALELEVSDTRFLDSIRLTRRYVAFRVYRSQGWLSPVLLVDGRMEGVWRHERKGGRLIVDIEPFAKQPEWVRDGRGSRASLTLLGRRTRAHLVDFVAESLSLLSSTAALRRI
jgi:DNA glycosylase AlkZ-like